MLTSPATSLVYRTAESYAAERQQGIFTGRPKGHINGYGSYHIRSIDCGVPMIRRLLLIMLFSCISGLCAAAQCAEDPDGQYHFSMEDDARSLTLPSPIADLLAQDPDIVKLKTREHTPGGSLPNSWISVAEIKLSKGVEGYAITGQWPIAGANVTTFWVFIENQTGPKEVLKTAGHDLLIGRPCIRSFKTIQASYEIAGHFHKTNYVYDGRVYIQSK